MKIKVKKMSENTILPERKTSGAAGFDMFLPENVKISANSTTKIKSGIAVELPTGYAARVVHRSSIFNQGLVIYGTIDNDYVGEIGLNIINTTDRHIFFDRGDRIAQLIPFQYFEMEIEEADELKKTERGAKGFGSTGK